MTTARERMIALSGLAGAHTAREHFLAIMQGTGQGTVFASMFAVQIDEPRLTLVQIPTIESRSSYEPPEVRQSGDDKDLFILTRTGAMSVLTTLDEIVIRQSSEQDYVVRTLDDDYFTVRDVGIAPVENTEMTIHSVPTSTIAVMG